MEKPHALVMSLIGFLGSRTIVLGQSCSNSRVLAGSFSNLGRKFLTHANALLNKTKHSKKNKQNRRQRNTLHVVHLNYISILDHGVPFNSQKTGPTNTCTRVNEMYMQLSQCKFILNLSIVVIALMNYKVEKRKKLNM